MTRKKYNRALRKRRVIHLAGDIDLDLVKSYRVQLAQLLARGGAKGLVIVLSCGGGDLSWANVLYDEICSLSESRRVWLLCEGKVRSPGIVVMMAVPRKRRFATERTDFRVGPHILKQQGMKRVVGIGRSPKFTAEVEAQEARTAWELEGIHAVVMRGTGMSCDRAVELFAKPRFITPHEAKDLGII